jgi:ribosomal protein S27AE
VYGRYSLLNKYPILEPPLLVLAMFYSYTFNESNDSSDKLIDALEMRNANLPCARCGHTRFEVVGQTEFEVTIKSSMHRSSLAAALYGDHKQTVPALVIACSNCGNLSHHSLGILSKTPEVKRGTEDAKV